MLLNTIFVENKILKLRQVQIDSEMVVRILILEVNNFNTSCTLDRPITSSWFTINDYNTGFYTRKVFKK